MRLHRFISDVDLSEKKIEIRDKGLMHQLTHVLRLKQGESFILCDGKGHEAEANIQSLTQSTCLVYVGPITPVVTEYDSECTLYCSVLKKENFELVIQKATEIGISMIVPILTARTVKVGISMSRLTRITKEAAEQSGRGVIPFLEKPLQLEDAFSHSKKNGIRLFCDPSGSKLDEDMKNTLRKTHSRALFIGPEGGWDQKEIDSARTQNMYMLSLGKTILRAETAAITASYLIQNL